MGCWILLKESASGSAPDYRASKRNLHSGDVTLVKLHTPVASYSCQFPLPCLNLSVHSPIHLVINQSTRHAVIQPVTQPVSHSTTQPINQTSQSLNQSLTQPINHSTNQSIPCFLSLRMPVPLLHLSSHRDYPPHLAVPAVCFRPKKSELSI